MKKRDLAVAAMQSSRGLFVCPICRGELAVDASAALRCPSGHTFDIASSGYANMLTITVHADYGAAMLEARRRVCEAGFFDKLLADAADMIARRAESTGKKTMTVLDAGCGEGSHLARLADILREKANIHITGVGVDISKEGIHIAAREHPGFLWFVADLARLPFVDDSVDIIVNILSPSNYAEFGRVLKRDGMIVKAMPGEGYLRELRQSLYTGDGRESYTNAKTVDLFEKSFAVLERRHVMARFTPPPGLWPDIVAMTPLTWGRDVQPVLDKPESEISVEFQLLAGEKRN